MNGWIAVLSVQWLEQADYVNPRFRYVRLGDNATTDKISEYKGERVEIFRWFFRKILPEPCM